MESVHLEYKFENYFYSLEIRKIGMHFSPLIHLQTLIKGNFTLILDARRFPYAC